MRTFCAMIGMEVPHVKEFAERLREVQKQRKWTQREMAGHIGITVTSLSAYMNDRKTPALDVAVKIARALDVSIGWLRGRRSRRSTDNVCRFLAPTRPPRGRLGRVV